MHIDTHSQESIFASLSMLVSTSSEEIIHLLNSICSELEKSNRFYRTTFERTVIDYIYSKISSAIFIDEISFYHLSRRLKCDDASVGESLYTLLTTDNALSSFLLDHKVEFRPENGVLNLFYNNDFIPLEKSPDDIVGSTPAYLKRRLGHSPVKDFCFNGFAFRDQLMKNSYASNLYRGPEFIPILARYIRCPNLAIDYFKQSQYYCFEYKLPLDRILFDEDDTLDLNAKQEFFMSKLLQRILEYLTLPEKYIFDHDNPVLRLEDSDKMESRFYVVKEEITKSMLD